jgi:hypothetical protein
VRKRRQHDDFAWRNTLVVNQGGDFGGGPFQHFGVVVVGLKTEGRGKKERGRGGERGEGREHESGRR